MTRWRGMNGCVRREEGDAAHPRAYAALAGRRRRCRRDPAYDRRRDGVCLAARPARAGKRTRPSIRIGAFLRMADGRTPWRRGQGVWPPFRAAGGYLLAEISRDSLSEPSAGAGTRLRRDAAGQTVAAGSTIRTTGSESRLHELRRRMLAGEALATATRY